jgi:UDP-N-acetylglucosamine 2-epimerase (non-hydrolysing)
MMKILHIVGARPNFIKIAPIMRQMAKYPTEFEQLLIHTGQHYDINMSQVFFNELELPRPDVNLDVGSGTHAWQTAQIMQRFEPVLLDYKPDWVLVPGDVNSTFACSLVAAKLDFKVAHVEAGLRSFDRTMPEEINRLLTDQISDLLLTPSRDADENLLREGINPKKIHFVGNVMIDTLVRLLPKAKARWPLLRDQYRLDRYLLVTLHRPSNVDKLETLTEIMAALMEISKTIKVLFPVHPRTHRRIVDLNLSNKNDHLILTEPMGYLDFLALQMHASMLLTDSGGIQEETTYLGIPCLTARPNTERPVTIGYGTNRLVDSTSKALVSAIRALLLNDFHNCTSCERRPELWDGKTAERITRVLCEEVV